VFIGESNALVRRWRLTHGQNWIIVAYPKTKVSGPMGGDGGAHFMRGLG